ncbi:MAG: CHASE2 domain-containing protein, partial [Candidatus Omnitrophica bacterium]|nr:CHASE2 domain-containing protein [Candidatus Omnitrophota bacterium]
EAGAILSDLAPALKGAPRGESQINVFVDPDGKYRRAPLFIRYEGRNYPNLGFMSACDRLGLDAGRAEFSPGKVIIDGKLGIPVDDNAALLVNYPDRWERSFKHVSYFDILKSYSEALSGRKPHLDLGMFKGKTCFIGLTATGTADLRANPLEETYPMVGLQASIFNSVLQEKFITRAGRLANVLLALAIFAVSLLLCFKFSPLKAFLGILGFSAAYFIFAAGIFIAFGIWVDLFIPEWLMFTTYASVTFYRFFSENRRRQLLEKELDIARTIQKSFLPEEIKEFSGISISTFLEPAKFVAGDLFDILPLDEKRLGVLIGDVSGKGVPASLIMAQTLSLFRVFARQDFNCSDTLMRLNSELYGKFAGRFVTCLYMIIDTEAKRVRVASAGHGPLLVYKKKDNSIIEADIAIDVPLGIMEGVEYKDTEFGLDKADKLFVFTDGLTEARNLDSQEFGVENIKKIIGQNAGLLPQALSESLKKGVYKFSYRCPQHDDITLIVLGAT